MHNAAMARRGELADGDSVIFLADLPMAWTRRWGVATTPTM
jgi:hypothetical protein